MRSAHYGKGDLWWLSPLVGGLAPAGCLVVYSMISQGATFEDRLGTLTVWSLRDLFLGYTLALPVLNLFRWLGLRGLLVMWAIAAAVGMPIGFVLANPLAFAVDLTDENLTQRPQWGDMLLYMSLFGLTGVAFALTRAPATKPRTFGFNDAD